MISIEIQESEAYDRLSILELKRGITKDVDKQNQLFGQIEELESLLNNEIGYDKAKKIHDSYEYKVLASANQDIFKMIDSLNEESKGGNLIPDEELIYLARHINFMNYQRFLAKENLQKKFFDNEIKEVKVGYDH